MPLGFSFERIYLTFWQSSAPGALRTLVTSVVLYSLTRATLGRTKHVYVDIYIYLYVYMHIYIIYIYIYIYINMNGTTWLLTLPNSLFT